MYNNFEVYAPIVDDGYDSVRLYEPILLRANALGTDAITMLELYAGNIEGQLPYSTQVYLDELFGRVFGTEFRLPDVNDVIIDLVDARDA